MCFSIDLSKIRQDYGLDKPEMTWGWTSIAVAVIAGGVFGMACGICAFTPLSASSHFFYPLAGLAPKILVIVAGVVGVGLGTTIIMIIHKRQSAVSGGLSEGSEDGTVEASATNTDTSSDSLSEDSEDGEIEATDATTHNSVHTEYSATNTDTSSDSLFGDLKDAPSVIKQLSCGLQAHVAKNISRLATRPEYCYCTSTFENLRGTRLFALFVGGAQMPYFFYTEKERATYNRQRLNGVEPQEI